MPDNLELAADGLADARAKLEAVSEALQPLLDGPGGELAVLVDRIDRMAAEVARIEGVIAGQTVGMAERA